MSVETVTLAKASHDGIPSQPLTWGRDGGRVYGVCANGHIAAFDHDVDETGKVTPSLWCRTPTPDGECGWHVMAQLEDWTP